MEDYLTCVGGDAIKCAAIESPTIDTGDSG